MARLAKPDEAAVATELSAVRGVAPKPGDVPRITGQLGRLQELLDRLEPGSMFDTEPAQHAGVLKRLRKDPT